MLFIVVMSLTSCYF